jgi:toxin YhaV
MSRSKGQSPSDRRRLQGAKSGPAHSGAGADDVVFSAGIWTLRFHPLLLDQIERVVSAAEQEQAARGPGEAEGPNTKLARAMRGILFTEVPEDPSRAIYRHGGTLETHLKHWLRAKFGNGRFRLFFRYRKDAGLIVYAWVNDTTTLRTYGSNTDAYTVFHRMLGSGNPPDDWDALVSAASAPDALGRARALFGARDLPPER